MLQALLVSVTIIVLFGIVVPLVRGLDFLNPLLLSAYMMLGVVIVAPAAASAFSGSEKIEPRAALRKLGAVTGFAWGLALATVAAGLITVNVASHYHRVLLPNGSFLAAGVLSSATATVFTALLAAIVARRYSVDVARNAVRLIFLGLVIFGFALSRFGGPDWVRNLFRWTTTAHMRALCTAMAAVLAIADVGLAVLLARFIGSPSAERYSVP